MQRIVLILFLLLSSYSVAAQSIEELYKAGNHAALVKQLSHVSRLSGPELYMIGSAFFQLGQDDQAVIYLDKALAKGLTTGPVYLKKGLALRYAKKYSEALKAFDSAIEAEPQQLDYQVERAMVFYQAGQYDNAIRCFEQLKAMPNCPPEALYMVPHLHHLQEHHELALSGFYEAITVLPPNHPNYLEALMDIGKLEYTFTHNFHKAATAYMQAVQQFPTEFLLYSKAIKAYNGAGQYSQADSLFSVFQSFDQQHKLPEEFTKFRRVAVDEYSWNKRQLLIYRSLDDPKSPLDIGYKIYLLVSDGEKIERTFTVEQTLPINDGATYLLCETIRASGGHRTYPYGWKADGLSIETIRKGVSLVLEGKIGASASSTFGK